jgi:hypothetical protein
VLGARVHVNVHVSTRVHVHALVYVHGLCPCTCPMSMSESRTFQQRPKHEYTEISHPTDRRVLAFSPPPSTLDLSSVSPPQSLFFFFFPICLSLL